MEYKYNDDFQCISATDATETRVPKSQPVNVDDISAGAGTADGVHISGEWHNAHCEV